MRRKKFRRLNNVILPGFQLKLAVSAVIFLMIYSFVLGVAIFYPLASEFFATTDAVYRSQLAVSVLKVHEHLWPALGCISILVFLGAILLTHRIAGPIFRFEKTVETLTEGNFGVRIKLRKRDEFHEFAEKINNLAISLEKRQVEEISRRRESRELLNQLLGKMAAQNGNKVELLQPTINELMARFDAPSPNII